MTRGGVCPVCEIPDEPEPAAPPPANRVASERAASGTVEPAAPTALGRAWQSGRLAVGIAAACFVLATFIPLMTVRRVGSPPATPWVARTPAAMIVGDGPFGRELRSSALLALPAAAMGLASFLLTRRTRSVMLASRPLVLAVAVIPLLAAALPVLKLSKRQRFEYTAGPAMVVIALGAAAGVLGATRFGRGTKDPSPRRRVGSSSARAGDEDEED